MIHLIVVRDDFRDVRASASGIRHDDRNVLAVVHERRRTIATTSTPTRRRTASASRSSALRWRATVRVARAAARRSTALRRRRRASRTLYGDALERTTLRGERAQELVELTVSQDGPAGARSRHRTSARRPTPSSSTRRRSRTSTSTRRCADAPDSDDRRAWSMDMSGAQAGPLMQMKLPPLSAGHATSCGFSSAARTTYGLYGAVHAASRGKRAADTSRRSPRRRAASRAARSSRRSRRARSTKDRVRRPC